MNVIEIRNISKQYPDTKKAANNNISFDLKKGEILCVAGENGAGKTTLMKILCGLEKQDSGQIKINGNIGMVHQHFMLFNEFTAAQNIVIGREPLKWGIFTDNKKTNEIADNIILENNFSIKANVKVKDLTQGEMQQTEICRVLYRNADIIILDEPTSILTESEVQSLFITLRKLADKGKSIILITHKLHEIKKISGRVAVLRKGELAGIKEVSNIEPEEIAAMMTGNDKNESDLKFNLKKIENKKINTNDPVISFCNVSVRRAKQKLPLLDNVSFTVYKGEALGFAGVGGNGLGVIEAVLGGFLHPASGKIFYKDKDISGLDTTALRKLGLAYVPADRIRVGSAAEAAIEENIIINKRKNNFKKNRILEMAHITEKLINDYNIDAPEKKFKASTLSGGNLQKLILAREIDSLKDYIVLSNPTWGLDAESSRFVMNEIIKLKERNAAVILISNDLDEIIKLADRIIVMYKGRTAGVFANNGDSGIKEMIVKSMQTGIADE